MAAKMCLVWRYARSRNTQGGNANNGPVKSSAAVVEKNRWQDAATTGYLDLFKTVTTTNTNAVPLYLLCMIQRLCKCRGQRERPHLVPVYVRKHNHLTAVALLHDFFYMVP